MKPDKKHIAILAIPEMDDTTVTDARKLFFGYKEKEIITEGTFDDDVWGLCDEYARYHLDFSFDSSCLEFVEFSRRFHITAADGGTCTRLIAENFTYYEKNCLQ